MTCPYICASVWGRLRAFCNLKRFFPSQQTGFSPSGDCKFSINPSRNPLANRGDRDRLLAGNGGKVAVYSIGQARQGGIVAWEESPSILCRSTSLGLTAIFSNDSTTPRGYQPSKTWHRDNYSRISASNAIIPRGSPEADAFYYNLFNKRKPDWIFGQQKRRHQKVYKGHVLPTEWSRRDGSV